MDPHKVWTVEQCVSVFLRSTEKLCKEMENSGSLAFDKENSLTVDFVSAASNLRSYIYDIPMQSKFDAKVRINRYSTINTNVKQQILKSLSFSWS